MKPPREVDLCLEEHLREVFGPEELNMVREHHFEDKRLWRFDYALWVRIDRFSARLVAIEIEGMGPRSRGGIGRHQGPKGFQEDCDKYNAATARGWTIFRFTTKDILTGREIEILRKWREYVRPSQTAS